MLSRTVITRVELELAFELDQVNCCEIILFDENKGHHFLANRRQTSCPFKCIIYHCFQGGYKVC